MPQRPRHLCYHLCWTGGSFGLDRRPVEGCFFQLTARSHHHVRGMLSSASISSLQLQPRQTTPQKAFHSLDRRCPRAGASLGCSPQRLVASVHSTTHERERATPSPINCSEHGGKLAGVQEDTSGGTSCASSSRSSSILAIGQPTSVASSHLSSWQSSSCESPEPARAASSTCGSPRSPRASCSTSTGALQLKGRASPPTLAPSVVAASIASSPQRRALALSTPKRLHSPEWPQLGRSTAQLGRSTATKAWPPDSTASRPNSTTSVPSWRNAPQREPARRISLLSAGRYTLATAHSHAQLAPGSVWHRLTTS